MYDILPFPNINLAKSTEEQVALINDYLIQLKETLEFELSNISTENLSQELTDKLNALGADIEKTNENVENQNQQFSGQNTLTVSDVVNSPIFYTAVSKEIDNKFSSINFTVNFDTGNLEYTTS